MSGFSPLGQIALVLGIALILVNLFVGFNDPNPSPSNIGGNLRKAVTGQ